MGTGVMIIMEKNEKFISLLEEKIKHIDILLKAIDLEAVKQWRNETLMVLDNLIDQNSKYYKDFERLDYRSGVTYMGDPDRNREVDEKAYLEDLPKAKSVLNSIIFGVKNNLI